MRCFLCILCLLLLSCSDDDDGNELSFEDLCNYTPSNTIGENCSGDFLLHINSKAGEMKHSEELGYYVSFSVDKTFDCIITGIVCKGDYADFVGTTINVTADIHQSTITIQPLVGGQKMVTLANVIID